MAVEADAFVVYLDPHHDHLTGAQFGVSAAGVQRDALIYNDQFLDATWDAVWASAVSVDEQGWVAEMRIPLSQLRFPKADRYTWGINVQRVIQRRNESDWLQLVRKNEAGLASRMAELEDIAGIAPPGTLELMPYVTARAEFIEPPVAGNPFNDGARAFGAAGMDLKYGVTSSLTLDATFNPDFGQVEVDPAVVNLTQFEVFFEERRPFFTEGAKVFGNFGRSGASEYWGFFRPEPTLFYSRRIGRAPQGRVREPVRRRPGDDDDPRRGEAGRAHAARVDARRAECRHGPRAGAPVRRPRHQQARRRAADQLRGDPGAARTGCHAPASACWAPR